METKYPNTTAEPTITLTLTSTEAAMCLGTTKAGYPRHPLYVRAGAPLE